MFFIYFLLISYKAKKKQFQQMLFAFGV